MNKKGFTLVELLAVIVVLAILSTLTILTVNSILSSSQDTLSERQKEEIEKAAELYYLKQGNLEENTCVNISTLLSLGYLNGEKVLDPKTDEEMIGSVSITYNSNHYTYKYQETTCSNN